MINYTVTNLKKLVLLCLLSLLTACSNEVVRSSAREVSSDLPPKVLSQKDLNSENSKSDLKIANPSQEFMGLFDWPLDSARFIRGFSIKPVGKSHRRHLGIDLAAPRGTPVLAAQDGIVIYAGRDFKSFGRMVMIEGKQGFASLYAHLDKIKIKQGTRVSKGNVLGLVGKSGHAHGVHLHFEIRHNRGPVNPLDYLPAIRTASYED